MLTAPAPDRILALLSTATNDESRPPCVVRPSTFKKVRQMSMRATPWPLNLEANHSTSRLVRKPKGGNVNAVTSRGAKYPHPGFLRGTSWAIAAALSCRWADRFGEENSPPL